jgi:flagellar motor protein MotB
MENLRYLLAAIAAFTLVMSIVSSVNPNYFASLNAFADNDDEGNEDDKAKPERDHEKEEREHKQRSMLETDDKGIEIKVEVEGLNMTDGSYDAIFACESPNFNRTLDDAFEVQDGMGELEAEISLANGTYSGCELTVENTVLASFDKFTVSEETEEEQESKVEEKRKERKEKIVTSTNGTRIHERHRSENAASPGDYRLGWNYMLTANGTATHRNNGTTTADSGDAELDIDMAVWKSTGAIILLDVVGGTVEIENQTYTVVVGYALYTIHHDTFRMGALAVDDDGNVFKLQLRGSAEDDDTEFPMESGSIDLMLGGNSGGPSNNRFGDWQLALQGTIEG